MLGVERDRALVVVHHREIEAIRPGHVAELAARDVAAAGALDLNDIGAEPSQKLRAGRPGLHMREVQDTHSVQRFCHIPFPQC